MSITAAPVATVRGGGVSIGEKDINIYGILSYLDDDWPEDLVQYTFDLTEAELEAILTLEKAQPDLLDQIADRQREEFNQRLLTSLHGTHGMRWEEYSLPFLLSVVLFPAMLIASLYSHGSKGELGDYFFIGILLLMNVISILYTIRCYKNSYTFDGCNIIDHQILRAQPDTTIPYSEIDTMRSAANQHYRFLRITTKDGKTYDIQRIKSIQECINSMPEEDQYLL